VNSVSPGEPAAICQRRAMKVHMPKFTRKSPLIAFATLLLVSGPLQAEEICTFAAPTDISIERELLITDLSVVNDARASSSGAWSFGGLLTTLAPSDAPALVKHWLDSFERRQEVNGFPLPPRPAMRARLTRLWMATDGATTFADWTPNLANAPFRLLAIV